MADNPRSLIVVADRETARFFHHAHPGAPIESRGADIVHESPGDRNADRPGRTTESFGSRGHPMEPPTSYQEHERQEMAADIAARVHRAFDDKEVDRLVLLAEPKLLGEIRQALTKAIRERVVLEIDSHLTQTPPHELAQRLTEDGTLGIVRAPEERVTWTQQTRSR